MFILSKDIRVGQTVMMFMTVVIFLFNLPFYFTSDNPLPLLLSVLILLFFNWMAWRIHYIYIQEGKFHIASLYSTKKIIDGNLFLKIEEGFPGHMCYRLDFRNGQHYTFVHNKQLDLITFFREGEEGIIRKLTQGIKQELAKGVAIKGNKVKMKRGA